jgi:hypothetical protein
MRKPAPSLDHQPVHRLDRPPVGQPHSQDWLLLAVRLWRDRVRGCEVAAPHRCPPQPALVSECRCRTGPRRRRSCLTLPAPVTVGRLSDHPEWSPRRTPRARPRPGTGHPRRTGRGPPPGPGLEQAPSGRGTRCSTARPRWPRARRGDTAFLRVRRDTGARPPRSPGCRTRRQAVSPAGSTLRNGPRSPQGRTRRLWPAPLRERARTSSGLPAARRASPAGATAGP